MTVEDLEQVVEIENRLFSDPWTKEGFFTFLTKENTMFFVIEEKEKILAYCSMQTVLDEGDILNVAVSPDRQREGIGYFLVDSMLKMAEMIGKQNDLTVISVKDYIRNPKASGYKSYHMIVTVPIFLSDRVVDTKVEIQIRTIAMDFWASLEHKIYYKFEGNAPEYISHDLRECAEIVTELDAKMLSLNEAILKAKAEQREALKEE